jgi:hypothetical protein
MVQMLDEFALQFDQGICHRDHSLDGRQFLSADVHGGSPQSPSFTLNVLKKTTVTAIQQWKKNWVCQDYDVKSHTKGFPEPFWDAGSFFEHGIWRVAHVPCVKRDRPKRFNGSWRKTTAYAKTLPYLHARFESRPRHGFPTLQSALKSPSFLGAIPSASSRARVFARAFASSSLMR